MKESPSSSRKNLLLGTGPGPRPRKSARKERFRLSLPSQGREAAGEELEEVVVQGRRERHEVILDHVSDAKDLLRDVELEYVFTGKGSKEVLRGRPVVFALWSETKKEWSITRIEIPRPPFKWKPGRKPFPFIVLTPGVEARHVKGTGAERLMFAFSIDGEQTEGLREEVPRFRQ